MSIHQHNLFVRTLGEFTIVCATRPVTISWPDNATRLLFCSLLSPLDAAISRDRLCQTLWGIAATEAENRRLHATMGRLQDVISGAFGINPFIISHEGFSLDAHKIQIDARDFHETAIAGLRQLSLGNKQSAHSFFQTAASLYRGAFLPGISSRIITTTRTELEQQLQLLTRLIAPPPLRSELKTVRRPAALCCSA